MSLVAAMKALQEKLDVLWANGAAASKINPDMCRAGCVRGFVPCPLCGGHISGCSRCKQPAGPACGVCGPLEKTAHGWKVWTPPVYELWHVPDRGGPSKANCFVRGSRAQVIYEAEWAFGTAHNEDGGVTFDLHLVVAGSYEGAMPPFGPDTKLQCPY